MIERPRDDRRSAPASRSERDERRSGGGSRREFKYQPRTAEMVRKVMDSSRTRFDSPFRGEQVRWKSGDNTARILPPTWQNAEHYALQVWEHRYVGPEESHYLCLRKMKNERCPICDAERETRDHGDTEAANKLKPMQRWVCYILHREAEQEPLKPRIWDMNGFQNEEILEVTRDRKTNAVLFVEHLEEGYDLTFRRTGQKDRTRYGGWQFDRDPSPAAKDSRTIDDIMAFLEDNPLDEQLRFFDADYLENMLYGTAEAKDADLDPVEDRSVATSDARGRGGARDPDDKPWRDDKSEGNGRDRYAHEQDEADADRENERKQPGRNEQDEPEVAPRGRERLPRDDEAELTRAAPPRQRPRTPSRYSD